MAFLYVPCHLLMWAELIKTCFSPVAAGREAVYISYHRMTHVHVTKHPNQCSCTSETNSFAVFGNRNVWNVTFGMWGL